MGECHAPTAWLFIWLRSAGENQGLANCTEIAIVAAIIQPHGCGNGQNVDSTPAKKRHRRVPNAQPRAAASDRPAATSGESQTEIQNTRETYRHRRAVGGGEVTCEIGIHAAALNPVRI